MRGKKVDRRFGWDCHGLPAELEAEKQLGIKDKSQIDAMGLAEFNAYCKQSVLRYTDEWRDYVTRQARWVDFDNDYKTLDLDFMESVMWAFKELYDKGLIYQGFRVLPYSWYEQTPLSNQETRLDDAYKMRQDPAVTVDMLLTAPGSPLDGANALIWTTTPWTLPSTSRSRSIRMSTTCTCGRQGLKARASVTCWPPRGWGTTRANSVRRPRCSASTRAATWWG